MDWKDIKNIIKEELKKDNLSVSEIETGGGRKKKCKYTCKNGSTWWGNCCKDGTPCEGNRKKGCAGKDKIAIKSKHKSDDIEEASVTAKDTQFNLRTGVNKNPTKLGVKIQFEPSSGAEMDRDTKAALEIALQEKLNDSLKQYGIQVSKDTDIPRPNVIGFFIPLAQVKNLIVKALGGKADEPTVPAPEPEKQGPTSTDDITAPKQPPPPPPTPDQMVNEQLISEMRIKDLNEASKIVMKEDFYNFINAGNNILRTFEENGKTVKEAKAYIKYLTAHNIM